MSQSQLAITDFRDTLKSFNITVHLAWSEIKERYRGSFLGPFWITITMGIVIAALGTVYSKLFHQEIHTFIPFLTTGLLIWNFVTSTITESTDVFVSNKPFIENIKLPYNLYIYKLICRNLMILAHNSVVYFAVVYLFKVPINFYTLLVFPFLFMVMLNLAAVATILGLLGSRYRDLPPIVTSAITVVFFVSPVTWPPSMLGNHSLILKLNPFSYYLDLIRSPLLGHPPQMFSVIACSILTLVLAAVAFSVFAKYRRHIPFWL